MFGTFDDAVEAKIFFGSVEETKEEKSERCSPYDGIVVSIAQLCDAEDTKRALNIAISQLHLQAIEYAGKVVF